MKGALLFLQKDGYKGFFIIEEGRVELLSKLNKGGFIFNDHRINKILKNCPKDGGRHGDPETE